MMKQSGCLMMLCAVLILFFWVEAGFAESMQQGKSSWINPAWQDRITRKDLSSGITLKRDIEAVCRSEDDLVALLRDKLSHRAPTFSFDMVFNFTFGEVGDILARAETAAVAGDDYLAFSIFGTYRSWGGFSGDVRVNYTVNYAASADQEQQVDTRVDEVLASILDPGMNHEEQLKAIHDWIVLNVAYDTTYQEYSAWAALFLGSAVCQGYALLTCKMLQKCNIPVRIINSEAMNHAWNMVNLCGHWFHLDVTWNDPVPDLPGRVLYTYYNLSDSEISREPNPHYGWSADAFEAPESYSEGVCAEIPAAEFSLEDVLTILQSCAKIDGVQENLMDLDVNGDNRVGLEDVIYILRTISDTDGCQQ
jgi:hypothetical protein